MQSTKFTPGPWFIHDNLGFCVANIAKIRIASDEPPEKDIGPDARLIAAAPELLEALEKCRFALEPYDDVKPRDWVTDRERLRKAHEAARAAIAKATGNKA